MIFTSFEFLIFFVLVLVVRHLMPSWEHEKWFLLFASLFFYMSWNIPCVLILVVTTGVDFTVSRWMGKTSEKRRRKRLLLISIITNLGVLSFFKYTNFFLENTDQFARFAGVDIRIPHLDIILPVGISFFIFQSMSYTIDVYRGILQPCQKWRDLVLYVSFFPQLVAGPIVRAVTFLPQLAERARPKLAEIEPAIALILLGVVKKVVISDQIAGQIDVVFKNPAGYDALSLWLALAGYTVQIFCDFSGYSDIAIGCALLMGFHFKANFMMPYKSLNISEFWQRWHMSLSTWLRDYLYIPLGGNRLGRSRTYVNLMITMLLGGLWHGASWNFIFWGGLHGMALAVHKMWRGNRPEPQNPPPFYLQLLSGGITLMVVMIGWVFFRCQTFPDAWSMLTGLFSINPNAVSLISPHVVLAVGGVILAHALWNKNRIWHETTARAGVPVRILTYSGLLALIVTLGASETAPFIYFQF